MFESLAFIMNPEGLLIIGVIVLVLFGGKKIPELMRGAGQGIGEFKKGMEESKKTLMDAVHAEAEHAPEAKVETPAAAATAPTAGTPKTT